MGFNPATLGVDVIREVIEGTASSRGLCRQVFVVSKAVSFRFETVPDEANTPVESRRRRRLFWERPWRRVLTTTSSTDEMVLKSWRFGKMT